MSNIDTSQQATATPFASMGTTVLAALHSVTRALRIHGDRAHLHELPDHLLRDIGISRSEINSVTMFGGEDASRRPRG